MLPDDVTHLGPMELLGVDLFSLDGNNYLVGVGNFESNGEDINGGSD